VTARQFEYNYGNPGRDAVQERAISDALNLLIAMMEAACGNDGE
jgi:hypothetical protein